MTNEFLTAIDRNGFPVWAAKHVFQGEPIYVKRADGLAGEVLDVTRPLLPRLRAEGVLLLLVGISPGEPGVGHQFVARSNRDVPPFDNDPRTDAEIKQEVYDRYDNESYDDDHPQDGEE